MVGRHREAAAALRADEWTRAPCRDSSHAKLASPSSRIELLAPLHDEESMAATSNALGIDSFELSRFLAAQDGIREDALREPRAGFERLFHSGRRHHGMRVRS